MNNTQRGKTRRYADFFLATLIAIAGTMQAGAAEGEFTGDLKDAWLTGKAETVLALNEHLNRYSIGARVRDGTVTLTGEVATEIDRSLAAELMNGIAEIRAVNNRLILAEDEPLRIEPYQVRSRSSFARWIDDLTTTAIVRSRLIRHEDVRSATQYGDARR